MRVWDLSPGYLNRQSLLGEHREIHALFAVIGSGRRAGYARHPETLRFSGRLGALAARHDQLVEEMELRGYSHASPPAAAADPVERPDGFVDPPARQLAILGAKYRDRPPGRIRLPAGPADLFGQHKYSVLARDPERSREIGRLVSRMRRGALLDGLTPELVEILRTPPAAGPLIDALEHMWGHVARATGARSGAWAARAARDDPRSLLGEIRRLVDAGADTYLSCSTALGELGVWLGAGSPASPK